MGILITAFVLGVAPIMTAILLIAMRMAMTRSGSVHKLSRIDLRGMFLVTAGLGATLSLARVVLTSDDGLTSLYVLCFLPFLLPMMWLGRYAVQDLWEVTATRKKQQDLQVDMSFLTDDHR